MSWVPGPRRKDERKIKDCKFKNVSLPPLVATMVVFAAVSLVRAEENPAPTVQANSQLHASGVRSESMNDWLRRESGAFTVWDFG